jgi:general secretion pathway protein G
MAGFSLMELMVAVLLVGSLTAIAIPAYTRYKIQAQSAQAVTDLQTINTSIHLYQTEHGVLPDSLADVASGSIRDPWGRPYQYLKIDGNPSAPSHARKDFFLIIINSDYDLFSMGPDGATVTSLGAAASQDDAIRANDGGYFGLVTNY